MLLAKLEYIKVTFHIVKLHIKVLPTFFVNTIDVFHILNCAYCKSY